MTLVCELAINNNCVMKEQLNDIFLWTGHYLRLIYDIAIKWQLGVNWPLTNIVLRQSN